MSRCPNCESTRILVVLGPKPRASCGDCGCRWIQQGREQISIRLPDDAAARQTHPSRRAVPPGEARTTAAT